MSEETSEQLAALTALCVRLGSPLGQAEQMAQQLLKRSQQIAKERGIKQTEALDSLLSLMIKGRNGYGPDDPAPEVGSP